MSTTDASFVLASPLGPIELRADDAGLTHLAFRDGLTPSEAPATHPTLVAAKCWLDGYFAGHAPAMDLPLAPAGTPFQHAVWALLREIPHGETRSYEDLALALGDRKKTRAVGLANAKNPLAIVVACHRVLGKDGSLTGYAGGEARKAWLLAHERASASHAPSHADLDPRAAHPGTQLSLAVG